MARIAGAFDVDMGVTFLADSGERSMLPKSAWR